MLPSTLIDQSRDFFAITGEPEIEAAGEGVEDIGVAAVAAAGARRWSLQRAWCCGCGWPRDGEKAKATAAAVRIRTEGD